MAGPGDVKVILHEKAKTKARESVETEAGGG
jgi:hypothetical protein